MRLTLPAKTRKLPKAGMFRHKKGSSWHHNVTMSAERVPFAFHFVFSYIFDNPCKETMKKLDSSKFRRYSSIDKLDSFGNVAPEASIPLYYLEKCFLVCLEKALYCKVKHSKDIEEKKYKNKSVYVHLVSTSSLTVQFLIAHNRTFFIQITLKLCKCYYLSTRIFAEPIVRVAPAVHEVFSYKRDWSRDNPITDINPRRITATTTTRYRRRVAPRYRISVPRSL